MNMFTLISLSENDKRVLVAILLVFFLILAIVGLIGSLIVKIMRKQGDKIESLCHDVVITRVVDTEKGFKKYARKKNWQTFYKESRIPLLILLIAGIIYLLCCIILNQWPYDLFDYNETGFNTLFYIWDFSDCYTSFFGIQIISSWPTATFNTPHFEVSAIGSYIFVPAFLVGAIWYLVTVQAFIARMMRIRKLAHSIYVKKLDTYNQAEAQRNELSQQGQGFNQYPKFDPKNPNGNNQNPPQNPN